MITEGESATRARTEHGIVSAEEGIAHSLAHYFLQTGRFEDASPMSSGIMAAAAGSGPVEHWSEFTPFADLSVRAVGFSRGEIPQCIVYVTRASKQQERDLQTEIEGVSIRVRKVGRLIVRPEAASSSTNRGNSFRRGRKISCGSSIAPAGAQLSGTLGALLREPTGALLALSNNHVIGGCNHMAVGQPITSPSGRDVFPGGPPLLQFATFRQLVELRSGNASHVPAQASDAALALITNPKEVSSWQGNQYDTPTEVAAPVEEMVVEKTGRTTGHTTGTIESRIVVMMPLPYKDSRFSAVVNYANVWAVRTTSPGEPFALPGDSGSLIVTEDGQAAVGLLFAVSNNGELAFFTDITTVLEDLGGGLELASGL